MAPDCPTAADLADFALGRLDPSAEAQVAAHLDGCDRCRAAAAGAAPDGFLDRLRAAVPDLTGPHRPASTAAATDPVGTVLAGRYKLLERIGEGGMGRVYMADQLEPVRRRVAVKVVKPGMDSQAVLARFEAERQALALMDHPNIARVLDAGAADDGRPFFVMELVKGVPITQYCDAHRLTPRERLALFVPVCRAVQHAHQKGVIHRDLKPANILVGPYDGQPVPKVIDFGIAKATAQPLTEKTLYTGFGMVVGTPEYMAPEQATLDNLDVDTRADVYALGVVLYELLTGTTPLTRERVRVTALDEVLRLVREEEPPTPSARLRSSASLPATAAARGTEPDRLARAVRGELDWIVMKALEKDRSRRYETAGALAADVERYLADELVEARPPTARYRLRKFVRRHRAGVVTAGLVLAAVIAGVAGVAWQAYRADQRQRQVDREKLERLQDRLTGAALIALEQGDVRRMLAGLADAEASGLTLSPELRLERARAYYALGDSDACDRELDALPASADPVVRASSLLLRAERTLIGDAERALAVIAEAERGPLSDADREYVRGLRADAVTEAVDAFRAAIQLQPRHLPARGMGVIGLLLLGRLDEAHLLARESLALFPDHPPLRLYAAVVEAARGDRSAVDRAVARAGEKLLGHPEVQVAKIASTLFDIRAIVAGGQNVMAAMPQLLALTGELNQLGVGAAGQIQFDQFPPFMRPPVRIAVRLLFPSGRLPRNMPEVLKVLNPGGIDAPDDATLAALPGELDRHPEGTLHTIYGLTLYTAALNRARSGQVTGPDAQLSRRFRRAGDALARAYRLPMLADNRLNAIDGAAISYTQAAQFAVRPGDREELFLRAADLVAERVQRFGPRLLPKGQGESNRLEPLAYGAIQGGRRSAARLLLDVLRDDYPHEIDGWFYRAELEYADRSYLSAREAAARVLKNPKVGGANRQRAEWLLDRSDRALLFLYRPETAPPPRPAGG